jgi:membrane-anchored protein YejM (alkaline phosphatase superfamily)
MFQFTWTSKLAHDDFNRLRYGDSHLFKTLQTLQQLGTLNHTALVILSDHGSRADDLRKSRQGQLEDRLPLAYIVLPPWFSTTYPTASTNLHNNARLITSAYDLHETFLDFLDLAQLNDPHTHYIRQRKLKVAEKV